MLPPQLPTPPGAQQAPSFLHCFPLPLRETPLHGSNSLPLTMFCGGLSPKAEELLPHCLPTDPNLSPPSLSAMILTCLPQKLLTR